MKYSALFSAIIFALSLTACGEKSSVEEMESASEEMMESANDSAETVEETIEIVGDESPTTNDLATAAEEMTGDAAE